MSLSVRPFAHVSALDEIARRDPHNVGSGERAASLAAGSLLGLGSLAFRAPWCWVSALAGAALVWRGATGQCGIYHRLGWNTALPHPERGVRGDRGIKLEASTMVACSAEEAFRFWRRLENVPRFMSRVIAVEETADGMSHWRVRGPFGRELTWEAEMINEEAGSMFSWQTLPGSMVASAGSVWFEETDGGVRVKLELVYDPPAGSAGAAMAEWLGVDPESQMVADLQRFKELLETAE